MKIRSILTGLVAVLVTNIVVAATTGTVISVPSGTTLSLATIELQASRQMDSYSVQLYRVGGGEQASLNLMRSDPTYNTEWLSPNTWYTPGLSGYVAENDEQETWTWTLYDLPAGDYYVVYDGTGVVNSDYPLSTAQDLQNWLAYWFDWQYTLPTQGPYSKIVLHADTVMNVYVY